MKLFVHCFQDLKIKGLERPYLAEFIEQIGKHPSTARCVIKINKRDYIVHRQACSEKPFTMEELNNVRLETTPKPKRVAGRAGESQPKPKVEGSFW